MQILFRALLPLVCAAAAAGAPGANWPAGRGPEASGVTAEKNLPLELTNASLVPSNGELLPRTHKPLWCIGEAKPTAAAP